MFLSLIERIENGKQKKLIDIELKINLLIVGTIWPDQKRVMSCRDSKALIFIRYLVYMEKLQLKLHIAYIS